MVSGISGNHEHPSQPYINQILAVTSGSLTRNVANASDRLYDDQLASNPLPHVYSVSLGDVAHPQAIVSVGTLSGTLAKVSDLPAGVSVGLVAKLGSSSGTTAAGKITYTIETPHEDVTSVKLIASVQGAAANSLLDVMIGEGIVGQLATDPAGLARWPWICRAPPARPTAAGPCNSSRASGAPPRAARST